ncbi:hypothetical protein [Siminovitchia sp. 179-K 8D1 HS]|uniref:hypothetical protein n=1 Tax=Siminovitchia sp. 179-K 8D1 HS TaxID=3142385 RepID=UPI0039A286D1
MEKLFIVVEDSAEHGIETFIYKNKKEAKECYVNIINEYREHIKELGNGEIGEYWAELTNKWDEEVARVFWQEKTIQ